MFTDLRLETPFRVNVPAGGWPAEQPADLNAYMAQHTEKKHIVRMAGNGFVRFYGTTIVTGGYENPWNPQAPSIYRTASALVRQVSGACTGILGIKVNIFEVFVF